MVPGVEGSSPFTHPRYLGREPERRFRLSSHREPLFPPMMGCRQVVRHGTLTPAFAGSSPATPAIFDPLAQLAEHLPFKQGVRGSNPRRVTMLKILESLVSQGVIVIRYYLALRGAENGVTVMVTPFFCVQG